MPRQRKTSWGQSPWLPTSDLHVEQLTEPAASVASDADEPLRHALPRKSKCRRGRGAQKVSIRAASSNSRRKDGSRRIGCKAAG